MKSGEKGMQESQHAGTKRFFPEEVHARDFSNGK
jgi:hypothetical protein